MSREIAVALVLVAYLAIVVAMGAELGDTLARAQIPAQLAYPIILAYVAAGYLALKLVQWLLSGNTSTEKGHDNG